MSTAIRRIWSTCCALTGSGHAATAVPTRAINSRRLIQSPSMLKTQTKYQFSRPTACRIVRRGAFTWTEEALFDHLIGAGEQRGWHCEAERLCGSEKWLMRVA